MDSLNCKTEKSKTISSTFCSNLPNSYLITFHIALRHGAFLDIHSDSVVVLTQKERLYVSEQKIMCIVGLLEVGGGAIQPGTDSQEQLDLSSFHEF